MKLFLKKYGLFLLLSSIYAFSYWSKHNAHLLPSVIGNYIGDLLCIPLLAGTTLFIMRRLKNQPALMLSAGMIVFLTAEIVLLFEWLLPKYGSRFTADIYDVLCYTIGAFLFAIWQKSRFSRV
jgi:hypothetical protein